MKHISKFFNTIAGIYRTLVTITFFLAIVFTLFVDRNLLTAFYDLLGFDSVSPELIKIITVIVFFFAFLINFIITKRIFSSNRDGKHHLFNMSFAFIFLFLAIAVQIFTKEKNVIISYIFNAILILGSMFGLAAKAKGQYPSYELEPKDDPNVSFKDLEEIEEKDIKDKKNSDDEIINEKDETYDSDNEDKENDSNKEVNDEDNEKTEANDQEVEEINSKKDLENIDKKNNSNDDNIEDEKSKSSNLIKKEVVEKNFLQDVKENVEVTSSVENYNKDNVAN